MYDDNLKNFIVFRVIQRQNGIKTKQIHFNTTLKTLFCNNKEPFTNELTAHTFQMLFPTLELRSHSGDES